jgi:hypothetical protein
LSNAISDDSKGEIMQHHSRTSVFPSLVTLILLALALFGSEALAEEREGVVSPTENVEAVKSSREVLPVNPLMKKIQGLLELQKARVLELESTLKETDDVHEMVRVHREIESVKVQTEIEIFRAQLQHQKQRGDLKSVAILEEIIDGILERTKVEESHRAEESVQER